MSNNNENATYENWLPSNFGNPQPQESNPEEQDPEEQPVLLTVTKEGYFCLSNIKSAAKHGVKCGHKTHTTGVMSTRGNTGHVKTCADNNPDIKLKPEKLDDFIRAGRKIKKLLVWKMID
mmetsp:Transcript_18656/g.21026  ORF Transcript_18656/g.21026 Transcript_18656/m.21026 type:complete len:120 (-) Transcript_18656:167-526(-)